MSSPGGGAVAGLSRSPHGGDLEEARVELGRTVEKGAVTHIAGAGPVGVRVVQRLDVPATVGGQGRDSVGAIGDELPQLLGGVHGPRHATGHRHDGDRLLLARLDLRKPVAGLPQLRGDALEVVAELVLVVHGEVNPSRIGMS